MNPSILNPVDGSYGYDAINNVQLPYFGLSSTINYNDISNNNFITNYKNFNVSKVILNNNANPICAFITPTGFPYVTNIPSGLWIMNLYSYISSPIGSAYYYFSVYKNSTSNLIATSSYSRDVNGVGTTPPLDIYTMVLPFPDTPMSVTDRILVTINVSALNINSNTTLNTLFEGSNYSFLTTSLNSGTKLLSSNNNWSGQNNFSNVSVTNISNTNLTSSNASITSITTNTIKATSYSSTINLYTDTSGSTINMGGLTLDNTINIKTVGTLALGTTAGAINIGTGMDNGNINIGNSGTTTHRLNLYSGEINIYKPLKIGYTDLITSGVFYYQGGVRVLGFYANAGPYTTTGGFFLHGSVDNMPIGVYIISYSFNLYCNSTGSFRIYFDDVVKGKFGRFDALAGENTLVNISFTIFHSVTTSIKPTARIIVNSGSFSHNNTDYNCFIVRIS